MSITIQQLTFLTHPVYANAIHAVVVCLSVCHKPALYRNDYSRK